MYVPSSEFFNSGGDQLNPDYQDQDIWDLVGNAPYILSIRDTIRKFDDWFGTMDSLELLGKALCIAEKETYDRLAMKEKRPSEIASVYMPATDTGSSQPMTWYPEGTEENATDPVSV